MDMLWSASTTMRNPERAWFFLKAAAELEGRVWNHETQEEYQCLLIQRRYYAPGAKNLSQDQIDLLEDYTHVLTFEEARDIFASKQYRDPPMRGRTSFDPLEKMGLTALESGGRGREKRVRITKLGRSFLGGEVTLEEVALAYLLKFQLPNPLSKGGAGYSTKPFINTLRLIRRVNELCEERAVKAKGVSRDEFGIFALSIRRYDEVEARAEDLLAYRAQMEALEDEAEREAYRTDFVEGYLSTFQQPAQNTREYADNIIRYLRLTKYIYIRGGGYYVDLEPRRKIEIDAILAHDNGSARAFTREAYSAYLADLNGYTLPFETREKLTAIAREIGAEIASLEEELGLTGGTDAKSPPAEDTEGLKAQIKALRQRRTALQNQRLKLEYQEAARIREAVDALQNIRSLGMKPSVALEKWANIALNIIDDARLIQPNAPSGDDNEPVFTAPAGVPDIECDYGEFGAICEVTMLTSRDQWFNEGQPVMRHLRGFEDAHSGRENYCLFVAPALHADTLNTFWMAVKYEYQGRRQKIIPLTIGQLIRILEGIRDAKGAGRRVRRGDMRALYDACTALDRVPDSTQWTRHVEAQITAWRSRAAG